MVSANAVHAVRDLPAALERLHSLVCPDGLLMLIESTQEMAWFDFTTGLIEGWRHFDDAIRSGGPLLPASSWCEALCAAGFQAARAWPEAGSLAEGFGQHVIVARRAGGGRRGVSAFTGETSDAAEHAVNPALRAALDEASEADRLDMLRTHAGAMVARVLGLAGDAPPGRHERLAELGLDSLMALRLRNRLGQGLGLNGPLPASIAYDHPTIDAIADYLAERLYGGASPASEPAAAAPRMDAGDVSAMSDDEIEALLIARLDKE